MKSTARVLLAVLAAAVLTAGCRSESDEEKVARLRTHYNAELNSWIVRPPEPLPAPPVAEGEEVAEGAEGEEGLAADTDDPAAGADVAAGEPAAGEILVEDIATTPQRRDIVLDVVVHHDAREPLEGITLDVIQAGEDEVEKGHFRIWIPTAHLARGEHAQFEHILEGIEFTPGDRFALEVRHPVPPAERAEYREFGGG